jgi:hypothetical protein
MSGSGRQTAGDLSPNVRINKVGREEVVYSLGNLLIPPYFRTIVATIVGARTARLPGTAENNATSVQGGHNARSSREVAGGIDESCRLR